MVLRSRSDLYLFILFYSFPPYHVLLCCIFKPVFDKSFWEFPKGHDLKIDTDVALYGEQDENLKIVGYKTFSSAGVLGIDELQRLLYCVFLNREPGADLVVIRAVVVYKDSFCIRISMHFTTLRRTKYRKP